MDDKLRNALDEIQSAIRRFEADGVIDDDERGQLRSLVEKLGSALEDPAEHEGLAEQLEESAIRFEGNHPTISAVIRSAVDTLTGLGM
ncbi:DUF4404 family protein [Actinospongicola halichondriae]|uniref:DUF4404 family protein n=1 Tax=Actinospongicola halichondriae TaxID=3236844 RepID=UPI003D370C7D